MGPIWGIGNNYRDNTGTLKHSDQIYCKNIFTALKVSIFYMQHYETNSHTRKNTL